jgi:microcystin-dependent protein
MADQFVAEIRMAGFNFAPTGWAFCAGQILPISQNTALFSLLGTMYGGNGQSTFALPNLQGSTPIMWGQGPGLSDYVQGEMTGVTSVTLLVTEIPSHTHAPSARTDATQVSPANAFWGKGGSRTQALNTYTAPGNGAMMAPTALQVVGGSLPHNNMPPYLGINFIIALQGIFPPRG